jgi:hypothetical protein
VEQIEVVRSISGNFNMDLIEYEGLVGHA